MLQDQCQQYFDEYNYYSSLNSLGNNYLKLAQIVTKTPYYQILSYKSLKNNNNKTFLVIPSIFNSPEILFLSHSISFIDNLRQYGNVFLVDWFELNKANYLLEDYAKWVVEVVIALRKKNNQIIDLIGHCIGGNLAIAAAIIFPDSIRTLTLLSTPWDFSHFALSRNIHQYFGLGSDVQNLSMIPKLYIQILFFLMFSGQFSGKLNKFFVIKSLKEKDLTFRIENWLLSGAALPKGTYMQIMDEIIGNNMFMKLQWQVDNVIMNPSLITKPVYQIVADNDKIAPGSSILPLHKLFKKSTLIKVKGGHISYLINNKLSALLREYNNSSED
ncbi:alpha/beta fold hydrolase [Candidatus Tisiphia endosymbiont of Beris chalybata]|uniref:alpha/beta fold hydrolase n=1 Tax=Candidatus Tisiphia endosymbiont of Beris chalybata TaxID=3066262 RepID=UPI00312C82DB